MLGGQNGAAEVRGCCRTEHMSPHVVSVRLGMGPDDSYNKTVTYMLDLGSIRIRDLVTPSWNDPSACTCKLLVNYSKKIGVRIQKRVGYSFRTLHEQLPTRPTPHLSRWKPLAKRRPAQPFHERSTSLRRARQSSW